MAHAAAWILVDDVDELRDRVRAVAFDVAGRAACGRNQLTVHHQQPVIVPFQEGLDDHRARMFARHQESGRNFGIRGQADRYAAAMVAVIGLGHHRKADALRGAHRLALGLHHFLLWDRQPQSREDLVGLFLVAGEFDRDVWRAAGHRSLDALLVLAVTQLHQ